MTHTLRDKPSATGGARFAIVVFFVALIVYVLTLAPGLLWGGGDFATFQTKAYTGQIESNIFGHPLWVVLARPLLALPIGDVAYRANLASAVFGAAALALVFLAAGRIARSTGAALLATAALAASHTFWTYAVMPKPYSLNALLLAACIYLLLRWGEERRGRYLYLFAAIYGLGPSNHLVMLTAAAGFITYLVLVAQRHRDSVDLRRQFAIAAAVHALALAPYALVVLSVGESAATTGSIGGFLRGFFTALTSPAKLLLGLGTGIALLLYQFLASIPIGLIGLRRSWLLDRPTAAMLALIAAGNVAFLLGATDPRTGGEYVWNLHYYLLTYVVFALWLAVGLAHLWPRLARTRLRLMASASLIIGLPVMAYALAPVISRPFVANLPGFREVGGRDNLTYVLSPWKHTETGARALGESILNTLPPDSALLADYGIWSIVNYLQVVEGRRLDVTLIQMPAVGAGKQLPLILSQRDARNLFIADINRYYDATEIETRFNIAPAGPIYRLTPK